MKFSLQSEDISVLLDAQIGCAATTESEHPSSVKTLHAPRLQGKRDAFLSLKMTPSALCGRTRAATTSARLLSELRSTALLGSPFRLVRRGLKTTRRFVSSHKEWRIFGGGFKRWDERIKSATWRALINDALIGARKQSDSVWCRVLFPSDFID